MATLFLPGLIDPHVHLRDPGQTDKEDFYTGTAAALAGGYTTVLDMPNNKTPITTLTRLEEKITIARQKIVCDVGFYFGSLEENFDEFSKVVGKVKGIKLYLNETTGNFLINKKIVEKIMTAWPKEGGTMLFHAEDNAVAFVIELTKKHTKHVHFCHISTKSDLEQIMQAKEQNLPVTCGVTPHHLFLTESDTKRLGPFGKMKPPLRPQKDVNFLWKHLSAIDSIESDHAPHTLSEKLSDNPPFGVPGLETTLPLLLTAQSQGKLTLAEIIRLCHTNPAKIFHIRTDKTTKVEIDPNRSYTIDKSSLYTKCPWSPFAGKRVKGKVIRVWVKGRKVFENGKIVVLPGSGRII